MVHVYARAAGVSLDFCRARRRIPTLRVCFHDKKPRTLWALARALHRVVKPGGAGAPNKCGVEPSYRVQQQATMELWLWLEEMWLIGVGSEEGHPALGSLGWVAWPPGLRLLVLDVQTLQTPLQSMLWPVALRVLMFGDTFN